MRVSWQSPNLLLVAASPAHQAAWHPGIAADPGRLARGDRQQGAGAGIMAATSFTCGPFCLPSTLRRRRRGFVGACTGPGSWRARDCESGLAQIPCQPGQDAGAAALLDAVHDDPLSLGFRRRAGRCRRRVWRARARRRTPRRATARQACRPTGGAAPVPAKPGQPAAPGGQGDFDGLPLTAARQAIASALLDGGPRTAAKLAEPAGSRRSSGRWKRRWSSSGTGSERKPATGQRPPRSHRAPACRLATRPASRGRRVRPAHRHRVPSRPAVTPRPGAAVRSVPAAGADAP
jgi:hypothetical protein